ncbi:MAG: hypothetical protein ABRQ38_10600 [Candidatus Eremiobacterota bacterium]
MLLPTMPWIKSYLRHGKSACPVCINENLPFISCYEKRILFFTLDGRRVTGWPGENDDIWNSAPGNLEGFYCTLIVTGRLKAVN